MVVGPSKADHIIWYLMVTFLGIIILGGGAWAATITTKVDKIAALEVNVQYIQSDISDIRNIIRIAFYEEKPKQNKGVVNGN